MNEAEFNRTEIEKALFYYYRDRFPDFPKPDHPQRLWISSVPMSVAGQLASIKIRVQAITEEASA